MIKKNISKINSGFTLIEVILSIAILAIISVPLMNYFSESLRHSALSAQKQKAVLAAQDMIEFIKAQDRLMIYQESPSPSAGGAMCYDLTDALRTKLKSSDTLLHQDEYHPDEGWGILEYLVNYPADTDVGGLFSGYDMKVTFETAAKASDISRPIIYGIDDDKNIVAAEHEEETEALAYFYARYVANALTEGGSYSDVDVVEEEPTTDPPEGTPPAGATPPASTTTPVTLKTPEELKENLRRTIHVEITKETVAAGDYSGDYYKIKVWYEYTCTGVIGPGEDVFASNPLIETSIEELEGIYLMFNKLTADEDKLEIEWDAPAPPAKKEPEFRLICQDLISGEGTDDDPIVMSTVDNYELQLKMTGLNTWDSHYEPSIRTNIIDNDNLKVTLYETDLGSHTLKRKPLTDSSDMPVRIFKVTVEVYKIGESETGDALVKMETTKTE